MSIITEISFCCFLKDFTYFFLTRKVHFLPHLSWLDRPPLEYNGLESKKKFCHRRAGSLVHKGAKDLLNLEWKFSFTNVGTYNLNF